jgi:hypothetical protein
MKQKKAVRKRYKKTRVYPFLSQMYSLFDTSPDVFVLEKLNCEGVYNPMIDKISIDYRKQLIPTLVHEVLHYLHFDWCETRVIKEERKIMNALSPYQIRTILKKFGQIL